MNEFNEKKLNTNSEVGPIELSKLETNEQEVNNVEIENQSDFEVEAELGDIGQKEIKMPAEHVVIANNESIRKLLGEALGIADPEGSSSIILIEYIDDEVSQMSMSHGLDFVKDLAEKGDIVIISGWQTESSYSKNPIWHAAMAYPNVHFVRLPFALADVRGIIEASKKETSRPEDPLAKRLPDLRKDQDEIQSLEHIMNRMLEAGGSQLIDWENKARKIFGNEITLDEIVQKVRKNNPSSIEGQLAGESYPDLCVDIEGTLIRNGEINLELLEKIKMVKKEQPITIWTGGDIEHYGKILRESGIAYKILSKYWLKGAKVAKAIDDMSEEEFKQKYDVEVEQYIQIPKEEK